jgi:hypothetical protein
VRRHPVLCRSLRLESRSRRRRAVGTPAILLLSARSADLRRHGPQPQTVHLSGGAGSEKERSLDSPWSRALEVLPRSQRTATTRQPASPCSGQLSRHASQPRASPACSSWSPIGDPTLRSATRGVLPADARRCPTPNQAAGARCLVEILAVGVLGLGWDSVGTRLGLGWDSVGTRLGLG